MKMKTKLQIAALLSLIGIMAYVNLETDIKTVGKLLGYAILIMIPLGFLIWRYKETLNKIPKGVVALSVPVGLFFWQWLHTKSFFAEAVLEFVFCLIFLFIAFFFDEKDIKL